MKSKTRGGIILKNGIKTLAMWLVIGVIFIVVLSAIVENSDSKLKYSELITNINNGNVEDIQIEAKLVANKIKQLIESKFQIFDKKINKFRDITYKDIVILLRSTKTTAPIYEQELLNLEIPVFSDASQEYLDSIEIQTIICLLKSLFINFVHH